MKLRTVLAGIQIGNILVGEKARFQDPRITETQTPISYIIHGNLRECVCKLCERTFFLSTYILERREPKSCGCLQLTRSKRAYKREVDKGKIKRLMTDYKTARSKGDQTEENRLYKEILDIKGRNI